MGARRLDRYFHAGRWILTGAMVVGSSSLIGTDWPNCSPSDDVDLNPGGSIACGSGPAVSLPPFDIILVEQDGQQVEFETTTPLTNVRATIQGGAVISDLEGIFAPGSGTTITNNGSINAANLGVGATATGIKVLNNGAITISGAVHLDVSTGIGVEGIGADVTNSGDITVDGSANTTGGEGIGIEGNGARVTNTFTGTITVDGPLAEAIGIEGNKSSITNTGDVAVGGSGSGGLGIEGNVAMITNSPGGTVAVFGDGSAAISIAGTGGEVTNSGNVLLNGVANIGIGSFGGNQTISHSGSVFAASPRSLGIGIAGASGSLALLSGARVDTESGSINVALAGSAQPGVESLLDLGIGSGATLTAAPGAVLNVGENSVGILIAHNDFMLPATPEINSAAAGAIGVALYGTNVRATVSSLAELSGAGSTLLAIGTKGTAAPDFVVTGGSATDATIDVNDFLFMSGEDSTVISAAGDDHDITVMSGGQLTTSESGTGIMVKGDRATIIVENPAQIVGGGIEVEGQGTTVTNNSSLFDKGIRVKNEESEDTTIENNGSIDLGNVADGSGVCVDGGGGVVSVGSLETAGAILGSEAAFGVEATSLDRDFMLTVGSQSVIDVPGGAVFRGKARSKKELGITVDAHGSLTGNSGLSIVAETVNVTTTAELVVLETDRWADGTTKTGIAIEAEAPETTWVADASITATSQVAVNADRYAISLTGPEGVRGRSISAKFEDRFEPPRLEVTGWQLSGMNLEADSITGEVLLADFVVNASGPGVIHGIRADVLDKFNIPVGSIEVPMTWAVLGEGQTVGYSVRAAGENPELNVVSSANLGVSSAEQPIGLRLEAATPFLVAPAIGAGAITFPKRRQLINEAGVIQLLDGTSAVGMLLGDGANDVRIENTGTIRTVGTSPGARGIRVDDVTRSFTINGGTIDISDGDSARGIELNGSQSVVVNGNADAAIFPIDGQILNANGTFPPDSSIVLSVQIDLSNDEIPLFQLPAQIVVNGTNAVGVEVTGDTNFVANLFGHPPLTGEFGPGTIKAVGANSIGVKLGGDNNTFYNGGWVFGELALEGNDNTQVVVNGGVFFDPVELNGGDDVYAFIAGVEQSRVDGGGQADADTLYGINICDTPKAVDFTSFRNFEKFRKGGQQTLIVRGTLDVRVADVRQGGLEIGAGATLTGTVFCPCPISCNAVISGAGMILGDLTGSHCDLDLGTSSAADLPCNIPPSEPYEGRTMSRAVAQLAGSTAQGARFDGISATGAGGVLTVNGDVTLVGGAVRVDIASAAQFDRLNVGGNLDFSGTEIVFTFLDGFVPTTEDTFDLFQAGGGIGGMETTSVRLIGVTGTASLIDLGDGTLSVAFEVQGLVHFSNADTLTWADVFNAQAYTIYRGVLSDLVDIDQDGLPDGGYGACMNHLDGNTSDTLFVDEEEPAPGTGWFYLRSFVDNSGVENGLGTTSTGLPRAVPSPCP